ncbi:MAG: iron-sulfur cluster assembly scaffold protein [Clostridia bacterium]|nr:iron-sulfur cluster assembly scaffold protein [Clostridia bacterium]
MYNKKLLEEFYNPVNVGVIKGADSVGKVKDRSCGDIVKIYIEVSKNTIKDVKFQAYGNTVTIAASSVATKLIMGKTLDEAFGVNVDAIKSELGGTIPANRAYSVALVEEAIKLCITSYFKKTTGKVPEQYLNGGIEKSAATEEQAVEEEADEEPVVEVKKAPKKSASKKEKKIKDIVDEDINELDEELDDLPEEKTEEVENKEPEVQTTGKTKTTKTVTKTVEIYNNSDTEEDEIYNSIDSLTSTIGEALKKLNEENEE